MSNTVVHKDGSVLIHRFERAGLGKAPFQLIGCVENRYSPHPGAPSKPGGTCAFCGTGIAIECIIRTSDNKIFKVGSDCVRHTGDSKLVVSVESELRKYNRIKREERKKAKDAKAELEFQKLEPAYNKALKVLANHPHPNAYFASQGKTLADYYEFCIKQQRGVNRLNLVKCVIEKGLK